MDKDGGKEEWGSIDDFPSGPVQVLGLAEVITRLWGVLCQNVEIVAFPFCPRSGLSSTDE